ncbi:MAG: amidase [Gemmatimonadetes bacterium]|nr:amidase [Gemmatimonadota bacterium]
MRARSLLATFLALATLASAACVGARGAPGTAAAAPPAGVLAPPPISGVGDSLEPSPAAPADLDVEELTVERVRDDLAAGRYSAVELTRAFLDRIERYEDHYNAFVSLNPGALAAAAALDAEYAETGPRGPLHGVPVVIKDNIDHAGLVTTAGFEGFSSATGGVDMIPGDDAAVVERLREAGAVILGKTNLPDFAGHGTRTNSTVAGVTLNPYDPTRVPGGSSGGTATAVNASFAVLGVGTETGGSIENPASAQGLVGVKPTYGLVPLEGIVPIDATYRDVAGPLARTVHDAAVTLDVLAGPTVEDLATYAAEGHVPDGGYVTAMNTHTLAGKRFGLVGPGWRDSFLPLAPETEALYRRAVQVLEARGAEVVEDPFLGSGFVEHYDESPRVPTGGAHDMLVYLQGLGPGAAFHSIEEWEAITGRTFGRENRVRSPARPSATEEGDAWQAWRRELRAIFRRVMEEHALDGLFFPQAGAPIGDLVEDPERPDHNPNNFPELPSNVVNDLGVPVVTLPFAYYDDGTPFAVAFIGDLWSEAALLGWARELEDVAGARVPPRLTAQPEG